MIYFMPELHSQVIHFTNSRELVEHYLFPVLAKWNLLDDLQERVSKWKRKNNRLLCEIILTMAYNYKD